MPHVLLYFVGTEFHQGEKFSYLFPNGFKARNNPLSVADGAVLQEEVTEDEWIQARKLPFRELCGVISYPAACLKVKTRLAVSMWTIS